MAHLLQPVDVSGDTLCPSCNGGISTPAKKTDIQIAPSPNVADVSNSCGPWTIMDAPDDASGYFGEISFAVVCGEELTLEFTREAGDEPVFYLIFVGPGLHQVAGTITGSSESAVIETSPGPCGQIVTIVAYTDPSPALTDGVATITVSII